MYIRVVSPLQMSELLPGRV